MTHPPVRWLTWRPSWALMRWWWIPGDRGLAGQQGAGVSFAAAAAFADLVVLGNHRLGQYEISFQQGTGGVGHRGGGERAHGHQLRAQGGELVMELLPHPRCRATAADVIVAEVDMPHSSQSCDHSE
jgi:hypothetical protein